MNTNADSVLFIVQSQADIPDDDDSHVFVIDSTLSQFSDEQYSEIEAKLRGLNVDSGTSLPLYNLFSLLISSESFSKRLLSLPECIYLKNQLERRIHQNCIETIHQGDILYSVEPLLQDVANNMGVKFENEADTLSNQRLTNKIISFVWTLPLLLDQLLGSIIKDATSSRVDTVFVPSVSRFESMGPVLNYMERDYAVVPNQAVISKKVGGFPDSSIKDFDPTVAHQYGSFKSVLIQLRYLFLEYILDELIKNKTETELANAIEQEFGIRLDNTIKQIFMELYRNKSTNSVLSYFVYMEVLRKTEATNIVCGLGYGPVSEAIWLAGQHSNANTYDLPHTITLNPPQTGTFTDYVFTTGTFAEDYIQRHRLSEADGPEILPTGRPYLEKLAESVGTGKTEFSEPIRILIATQPFKDEVRTEFVQESLRISELLSVPSEITIKLHPDESKDLYENMDRKNNDFAIEDENLWENLQHADLVLTLNSNVGLEAIIADALTVTINLKQFNSKRTLPYSTEGPVPNLTSEQEVQAFFGSLTVDGMNQLKKKQRQFVEKNYAISGAASRVASEIKNRSRKDIDN